MIPSHFSIINTFPDKPAPVGLNYYINCEVPPSEYAFSRVLERCILHHDRVAGMHTGGALAWFVNECQWRSPLTMSERDRLDELGYNYVGIVSVMGPIIYGHNIQGVRSTLHEVLCLPELLNILMGLRISTATERRWLELGAPDEMARRMGYHVQAQLRGWCMDTVMNNRLDVPQCVFQNGVVILHFKTFLSPDPAILTLDLRSGLWALSGRAPDLMHAAFLVFPTLKDIGAQNVFNNFTI